MAKRGDSDGAAARSRGGSPKSSAAEQSPGAVERPADGGGGGDALLLALGGRVRAARDAVGLTPTAAAAAAKITVPALWRIENGMQSASVLTLARVAFALETTMADLLAGLTADPAALGRRPFAWRSGSDPREPGWNQGRAGRKTRPKATD